MQIKKKITPGVGDSVEQVKAEEPASTSAVTTDPNVNVLVKKKKRITPITVS